MGALLANFVCTRNFFNGWILSPVVVVCLNLKLVRNKLTPHGSGPVFSIDLSEVLVLSENLNFQVWLT